MGRVAAVLAAAASLLVTGGSSGADEAVGGWDGPAPLSDCWSSDNGDPELTGVTVSPSAVDLSGGDQEVAVRVDVSDTGGPGPATGTTRVTVVAQAQPDQQFGASAELARAHDPSRGLSGALRKAHPGGPTRQVLDAAPQPDGSWLATLRLHRGLRSGTWRVFVEVQDGAGNQTGADNAPLPADARFDDLFTVTGPRDRSRPSLEQLRVQPTRVDVRRTGARVAVRARVGDDLGVARVTVTATPPGPLRWQGVPVALTPSEDDPTTWGGTLKVPPGRPGRWALTTDILDWANRGRTLRGPELAAAGHPAVVRVLSQRDDRPPQRPDLIAVTPRVIDHRQGDAAVMVRVRAGDRGSGVGQVWANLFAKNMNGGDDPDPEERFVRVARGRMTLVAGDARSGKWRARLTVPRCDAGRRLFVSFETYDRTGNRRFGRGRIGLPVLTDDHRRPESDATSPAPVAGPVTISFDEDVSGVSERSVLIRPGLYGYSGSSPDNPPVAGSWSCTDAAAAPSSCVNGPVRTARFHPEAAMLPDTHYVVEVNPEHVLDVLDAAGNPATGGSFRTAR